MKEVSPASEKSSNTASSQDVSYSGELKMDPKEWLPHVEDFDISEAQKIEVLQIVWNIMAHFVRLGWDIGTIHNFIPALREFADSGNELVKSHAQQLNSAVKKDDPAQKGLDHGLSKES